MTCTVNHLLIELGVSRRKLGHFVMGKEGTMEHGPILDGDIAERDRLRAVNAKLLEALEAVLAWPGPDSNAPADWITQARAAIKEAKS